MVRTSTEMVTTSLTLSLHMSSASWRRTPSSAASTIQTVTYCRNVHKLLLKARHLTVGGAKYVVVECLLVLGEQIPVSLSRIGSRSLSKLKCRDGLSCKLSYAAW